MGIAARTVTIASAATVALAGCSGGEREGTGSSGGVVTAAADDTAAPSNSAGTTSGAAAPSAGASTPAARLQTVVTGLDVPWDVAPLTDGSALVTLRDQRQVIQVRPGAQPDVLADLTQVSPSGEGGLMGIALSPTFATDRHVFVYYTSEQDNRIERFTWTAGGRFTAGRTILTGIPKGQFHNGGRIAFGPDGKLYAGTGDATEGERSQDRADLGGKILRLNADGSVPQDNPFSGSPVWSLGHRNVQGLAWDAQGRMYASEFGQNTWDELNLIRKGGNYGWPQAEGKAGTSGTVGPLVVWRPADASPSGLAIGADGHAYLAALRGEALWRIPLKDGAAGTPARVGQIDLGRVRAVHRGPDDRLWLLSNNTSGSGAQERSGDDRVVIFRP
ncbi:PQQ-dependent sugar dehydrogenase [Dermacoccaceae bacterium W4C1]